MVLAFDDDIEIDTALFELRRGGRPVALEPQAFDVLSYLVSHRDRVVPKQELMDAIWGGRFVTETAVTSRIKQVRRALGDDGSAQRIIRTVHGRGYRFVAEVRLQQDPEATDATTLPTQRVGSSGATVPTRYTVSDGLHVAYQVTGGGDSDIVLIPGFVSHLELDWADGRHAHFLDRLGSMGRLIRFDKRGTGMSDRPPGVPDLETRMHDVLAVMDAVGSSRAALVGYSEGGPMALLLAATHPDRVSSLVLYGCYAKRTWAPDYPWGQTAEGRAAYTERLLTEWDWEADCRMRCPSADPPMQRWWAQRMRAAATPSTIRALMDMNAMVDVRDTLPAVRVPTLVLHRTGDPLFQVGEARYLADHLPDASLRLLEGEDHLPCGDPDQLLDEIETFLHAVTWPQSADLALAAVVAVAGADGDAVVADLVGAGGRLRHDPDGHSLVLFDGPATALRAALRHGLGRATVGLSVAEVTREGDRADGPGVQVAVELADAAPAGSMWCSSTVGVLLSGTGVVLEPAHPPDGGPEGALRAVPGRPLTQRRLRR